MNGWLTAAEWVATAAGSAVAGLTWWRVAQREHYEPGRCTSTLRLWLTKKPSSGAPYALGAAFAIASARVPGLVAPAALSFAAAPTGLVVRKPFPRPAFTPRLRRLAGGWVLVHAAVAVAFRNPTVNAVLIPFGAPITDGVLAALKPLENALSKKFVTSAQAKLAQVAPDVVAITGSYGKTSTKAYTEALLAGQTSVYASPASFNNLMGLSRSVNDGLAPGTKVFVAEMGTYGPGEISRLTKIFPPKVAAITTIGEAHLERMGSRATIVRAKLEIVEQAEIVVLNVDVPELAAAADELAATKTVVRVSAQPDTGADVAVVAHGGTWEVRDATEQRAVIAEPPGTGHPTNLAVAIGIARALGVGWPGIVGTLRRRLPGVAHRAEVQADSNGISIIDDTYNANPNGAKQALDHAAELSEGHRLWVVTPGMVELGDQQDARNAEFARQVMAVPQATLVVVGETNRRPLVEGSTEDRRILARSRSEAMTKVGASAGPGDVVLFENDLPDHYP
ncbi:Mur ligase family protein [Geodermatophilus sp. SYSU D00691]